MSPLLLFLQSKPLLPILMALILGTSQAVLARQGQSLGDVDFDVSCEKNARPDFDRALALMHHMMYVQARSAFEALAEEHPQCGMAHWGIATTLFQPLWGTRPDEEDRQRGWQAIEKASDLVPEGSREHRLVKATEAFFRDPESTDFPPRLQRWAEAMAEAWRHHGDDTDTAALYTLSRLALAQRADDPAPLHDEAEAILKDIYQRNPNHPGAIHYAIHATDADGRAQNALEMVARYSDIAPEIPHALHMPSHIYVRLGDWPKVIHWNRRSADAALAQPAGGDVSHHYLHALDYLAYAYLQQGRDDRALAVLDEAFSAGKLQASFISSFHAAALPARYSVERHDWEEAKQLALRTPDYLPWDVSLWALSHTWLARGLGAVHTDDLEAAQAAEARIADLRDRARAQGDDSFATYIDIDRLILASWIASAEGNADKAVDLARRAVEREGTIEKHPVTPGALLPPGESLGDLLMVLDRPREALAAYQQSNRTWPGRYHTLLGAARAAEADGDRETAHNWYTELVAIAGDSPRPEIAEARRHLE